MTVKDFRAYRGTCTNDEIIDLRVQIPNTDDVRVFFNNGF